MGKPKVKIETSKAGFSIWLNDKWILDASLFLDDGEITIDVNKFCQSKKDEEIVFTLKDIDNV